MLRRFGLGISGILIAAGCVKSGGTKVPLNLAGAGPGLQVQVPQGDGKCLAAPMTSWLTFDVVMLENIIQQATDTEGGLAAGGEVRLTDYSVGLQLPKDPARADLVVGGGLVFERGSVPNGAVVTRSEPQLISVGVLGPVMQRSDLDFSPVRELFSSYSTALRQLAANGELRFLPDPATASELTLVGSDPVLNVFALTSEQLAKVRSLTVDAPDASTVIVNISGTNAAFENVGVRLARVSRTRVLFHFLEASKLRVSAIGLQGSLFAPMADISFENGVIDGHLFGKSLSGNGQTNHRPWEGCVPSEPPPPTVTPTPTPTETPTATPTPSVGHCTNTIGYWKNHSSEASPYLPQKLGNGTQAPTRVVSTPADVEVYLDQKLCGGASNGITKLYAQMLAAKLNVARGSSPSSISGTLGAADEFLTTYDCSDWESLNSERQQQILGWHSTFDSFNNGNLGPSHCK